MAVSGLPLKIVKAKLLSDLKEVGIETSEAERETELIIADITGLKLAQQILAESQIVETEALEKIAQITAQRKKRVPLQYCLGQASFMGLTLKVKPGVFIPRGDTETVVIATAKFLKNDPSLKIAEIGIGSGAISIAILKQLSECHITAIDVNPEAIALTKENALLHGVSDRLKLKAGDWKEQLPIDLDAIVSNPPYIPLSQKNSLAPEVAQFEPSLALYGGEDGLDFYKSFVEVAPAHLNSNAFIALEFGDGQDKNLLRLFANTGWRDVLIHRDLNGLPRVITATCPIKLA